MAEFDPSVDLLTEIKDYIGVTWQDEKTDKRVTGYIARGVSRLERISGGHLDFEAEGLPKTLLFDYCRYANSQALEVFEHNFQAELLDLNLSAAVKEYEDKNTN